MTDIKSNESRRKLLKSIAAGSGAIVAGKSLPESWTKPVVDSVMLPAHAQTSDTIFAGTAREARTFNDPDFLDTLIPTAMAQPGGEFRAERRACGTLMGDMIDIKFQPIRFDRGGQLENCSNVIRTGQLKTDSTKGVLTATPQSGGCEEDRNAWIENYVEGSSFDLVLERREKEGNLRLTCTQSAGCPEFLPICDETGC